MADAPRAMRSVRSIEVVSNAAFAPDGRILSDESFQQTIARERKRTERSGKAFMLMLVDVDAFSSTEKRGKLLSDTLSVLSRATRETDVVGWYKNDLAVGVMFTEIATEDKTLLVGAILARMREALRDHLDAEQFSQITMSCHMFPEDWDHQAKARPSNPTLYPDILKRHDSQKVPRIVKRTLDVLGSILALLIFSPLFLLIALAIKLTSKGPVLFRQERVGQYGAPFTFLKFRSMYVNNDDGKHKEYVRQLIAGMAETQPSNGNGKSVYKLTDDCRITPVGALLRKSSLDELPQFFNVLTGKMSLVGPRPAIPYEVAAYDLWHRRRLLETKPGITGLWQVSGRNLIKFDDMVRLDLMYARTWSPWLDAKILLRTPLAVLDGAH
jgi:lipopolysaccharide/colanic/teichoic acid biosynthesis glycosyltransferase/GGDEF domain-containing protein